MTPSIYISRDVLKWLRWSIKIVQMTHLESNLPQQVASVQFKCLVVFNSLRLHRLHHARPPCPSPTPGVYSNSRPSSRWCHPTISSSVVPFSSCLQSFLASGSFPKSQFFASGGQSIGVSASASVLPMNILGRFPSVTLRHVESSRIRDEIHVSCIGRWIVYHWNTRGAPRWCFMCIQCW